MRQYTWTMLAAVLGLSILAPKSPAQQPPGPREAAALRAIRNANSLKYEGLERTSAHRPFSEPENEQPYRREPAAPPPREVVRPNYYSQAHSYYPGMRTGLHSNASAVDTRTLCVPGRRAMLSR